MSSMTDALETYRRAEAGVRAALDRILSAEGLHVTAISAEGEGWRLHVTGWVAAPVSVRAEPSTGPAEPKAPNRDHPARSATALRRAPGETLMALTGRASDGLRIATSSASPGSMRSGPVSDEQRIRWLGATLVGDTILGLRHLGEPEDGPGARQELGRQYRVFLAEGRRLGNADPAPFLDAIDQWTPAGFPRGVAFLSIVDGESDA